MRTLLFLSAGEGVYSIVENVFLNPDVLNYFVFKK